MRRKWAAPECLGCRNNPCPGECRGTQPILRDVQKFHIYHGKLELYQANMVLRHRPDGSYLFSNFDTSWEKLGFIRVYFKRDGVVCSFRAFTVMSRSEAKGIRFLNVGPLLSIIKPARAEFLRDRHPREFRHNSHENWRWVAIMEIVGRPIVGVGDKEDLDGPCKLPVGREGTLSLYELALARTTELFCKKSIASFNLPVTVKDDLMRSTTSPDHIMPIYRGYLCDKHVTNMRLSLRYT